MNKEISEMLTKRKLSQWFRKIRRKIFLFLVWKRDGGYDPLISLKEQDLHYLKFMFQQVYYTCKLDLLFSPIELRLHESDTPSMVRQLIRIYLPVFWLRFSPTEFYEAFKSPDINLKGTDCKNSHIPTTYYFIIIK